MAASQPPDLWAFCAECRRWFYWERAQSAPSCPVCASGPAAIEDRARVTA